MIDGDMIDFAETTPEQRCAMVGYDYGAQHKDVVPSCNFCGCDIQELLATQDRYGYHVRAVKCGQCGLVYLSPRLTAEGYADFYDGPYRMLVSAYHNRTINAETIEEEQKEYARDWCEWARPYMPIHCNKDLLDIGGSTGVVSSEFKGQFGMRCTVVDPSPTELKRAHDRGHDTHCTMAEDMDLVHGDWDVIALFQTIDHLLDPGSVMVGVADAMPSGGVVLVDIVDVERVTIRTGRLESAIKIDHPFYFTARTAELLWHEVGLAVSLRKVVGDHVRYVLKKR